MRVRLVALAAGAVPLVGLAVTSWGMGASARDGATPASTPGSSPPPTSSTVAPPTAAAAPITSTHSIDVAGVKRQWVQTSPAGGLDAATRILVVLHGRVVSPQQEAQRDGFLPLVAPDNLELVYPAGVGASWNAGTCCGPASTTGVDDVAFLRALVTAVDPQHAHSIAMVGYSNGGRMAYTVACQSPNLVDGFAVVGALPMATCTLAHPVTVLQVAGTADAVVPFVATAGAATAGPNVTDLVAALRTLDGTTPAAATWQSGTVTMSTWTSSSTRIRVGLAAYEGGTHAWPGGDATTPGAAEVILRFFSTGDAHAITRAS
jgi:polyhydroxybutyrate depolymerase